MAENTNTDIVNNLISNNLDNMENKDIPVIKSDDLNSKIKENLTNLAINHADNADNAENINNKEKLDNVIVNSNSDNIVVVDVNKDTNNDKQDIVCESSLKRNDDLYNEKSENIILDTVNNENPDISNRNVDNENNEVLIVDLDLENKIILDAESKILAEIINKEESIKDVNAIQQTDSTEGEITDSKNVIDLTEIDLGSIENDDKYKNLLDMIFNLENEKQSIVDEAAKKINIIRKELTDAQTDNDKLRKRIQHLEQLLNQSVMLGGSEMSPKSKQEQEELLLRAKSLLFEKTKVNKKQEQQIEMLKSQNVALKDVAKLSKDMLNLKVAECEHTQARLDQHVARIKAEQNKCALLEKKLEISKRVYDKVNSEYEIQSQIFKELRESYAQKIKVLNETIEKMKE